jgi:hypothetical protein
MAIDISSTTRRIVYTGSAGVGPYAFNFEVLAQTDIDVYFNDTELTLTTDYTVTVDADGTGSVTIVTGTNVPTTPDADDRITIVGARTIERTTDFTTGGPLFATALNDEFDSQTIFVQQVQEQADRALRAPNTDPTTVNMTLPINTVRANKTLAFDANGDPVIGEQIGDNRGNWAAAVDFNKRDIVKDTTNNNIYLANTAHTSSGSLPISTNTDSAKWDLIVDAASASGFADEAEEWASKTNGIVESTDYSSKAWSIGGTGVTNTASRGAAKEWATKAEDSTVDGTEYSAKHYAAKAQASKTAAETAETNAETAETNAVAAQTAAETAQTGAETAQSAAEAARDATLAAYDSFDDRYLGAKASDPATDNDGDPLAAGMLYYNTTVPEMRLYTGSAWVAAYVSGGDYLLAANNLSDLTNTGTARTNLGLSIGTDVQAYDADTLKADTADTLTAPFRGTVTADNDLSFDQDVTNNFSCTPTAGGTLTFTNHTAGQSGYVLLDNSSGYAITAAATTKITATDLTTISTAGVYLISYFDNGTNAYLTVSASYS